MIISYREGDNEKVDKAEDEVDSGVDGESGSDNVAKEEDSPTPDKEPEEDVDYELIESVVHKGKFIKRQLSVQSHSKSVADLFSGMNVNDEPNLSITGSRKVNFHHLYAISSLRGFFG